MYNGILYLYMFFTRSAIFLFPLYRHNSRYNEIKRNTKMPFEDHRIRFSSGMHGQRSKFCTIHKSSLGRVADCLLNLCTPRLARTGGAADLAHAFWVETIVNSP